MLNLVIRFLIVTGIALPLWGLMRILYIRFIVKEKTNKMREFLLCVFVLFQAGLFVLVFQDGIYYGEGTSGLLAGLGRLHSGSGINLSPFKTMNGFINSGFNAGFLINIIGNIAMFIPLGFFLPLLWKRWQKGWKMAIVSLIIPLVIETTQLFIGRSVDIDDVILNAIGIVFGYGMWRLSEHLNRSIIKWAK